MMAYEMPYGGRSGSRGPMVELIISNGKLYEAYEGF